MGKGKPKVEVTEYFLSQHFGICLAEPDALVDVLVNEKSILDAPVSTESVISINKPDLFGGIKKEGGVAGNMRYMPGADDQLMPDLLAQKLGRAGSADCPGYRGKASLFFYGTGSRGFYWSANAPFVPGVWAKVRRILKRSDGSEQWYPEKAAIDSCLVEGETRILLEFFNDLIERPNQTYFIAAADGWENGLNGTEDEIAEEDEATTDKLVYNIVRPFVNIEFVWKQPVGPLGAREFLFQTQFLNGTFDDIPVGGGRILYKQPGMDDFEVLFAKPESTFSSNDEGYFGFQEIFPNRQYFDLPAAVGNPTDMNPAHIIRECLTDREFGMGTPPASLDDDAFRAAADTLYAENFGLSMIWTRQTEVQKFISEVLDHIKAVLYTDPRTGLLVLKLIRDDYDAETLPIIDPDSADLSSFSRKLWGDVINEVTVSWTNPENEQEETITAQDDASISIQGGVVSTSRNYYGVRCSALAQKLAYRDLRSDGQPLASCEAVLDRSQYDLTPGSVLKLTWPEYGLTELVMRVQEIDYGKPGDPEIKIKLLEDVFGLDIGTYDTPPSTSWVDPARQPSEMDPVQIFTLPYFMAANSDLASEGVEIAYPSVVAGILASSDNPDGWEYDLLDEVALPSGDLEAEVIASNNIIGKASLPMPMVREATSLAVDFGDLIGNIEPQLGGFVMLGDGDEETAEIAMVIADNGDGTYDLARGVLDTVPRNWPAGTAAFFIDEGTVFEDPLLRSAGETVDYKLLMRTSQGTLAADDADLESYTLTERPYLPLRPADVLIDGQAFSSPSVPIDQTAAYIDILITWANRNRIAEDSQVLRWDDATVTPESGQTTTIEVRDLAGVLITAHTGLTGTSFDLPLASFGSEGIAEVRVFSSRTDGDGTFASLQYWSEWVRVAGTSRRTEDDVERITESGTIRLTED